MTREARRVRGTAPAHGPVEAQAFAFLSATSLSATAYYRIPPDRVLELGTQLEV